MWSGFDRYIFDQDFVRISSRFDQDLLIIWSGFKHYIWYLGFVPEYKTSSGEAYGYDLIGHFG